MTGASIRQYAAALRDRYLKARRKEKQHILDDFCALTGYHRKSAIRLLHRRPKTVSKGPGRPNKYGLELVPALQMAWEASDRICSKRLAPFLAELIPILERHKELQLSEAIRAQLVSMTASTVDRLLAPLRRRMGRRSPSTTRPVSALKGLIPIRTWAQRKTKQVGHVEVDLAAHCGSSTAGFYLNTLVGVDLASGWTECVPVWGKGQSRVRSAVHRIHSDLPFALYQLMIESQAFAVPPPGLGVLGPCVFASAHFIAIQPIDWQLRAAHKTGCAHRFWRVAHGQYGRHTEHGAYPFAFTQEQLLAIEL